MEQHELFKSIYASNLKSRAINVMSCLITYMNRKDNTCFPSIKTIAKCCSISVNTVKRALADLVEAGFIIKETRFLESKNGAQTSNLYYLQKGIVKDEVSKDIEIIQEEIEQLEADIEEVKFEYMVEDKEIKDVGVNNGKGYFNSDIKSENENVVVHDITGDLQRRIKMENSQAIKWTGG